MDVAGLLEWIQPYQEVLISVGSALVAVLSALAARGETRRQRRLQTEGLRQSIDAASLEWGNAAIDALTRTSMFCRTRRLQANEAAFLAHKANMLIVLSTLVDRGRMFFPNYNPQTKGAEKDGAYRGHRPPILDALMWSYHELEALTFQGGPDCDDSGDFVDECRRLLVSELQAHLDPRRKNEIVERYNDQSGEVRSDAIARSEALKAKLKDRRPDFTFGADATSARRGS